MARPNPSATVPSRVAHLLTQLDGHISSITAAAAATGGVATAPGVATNHSNMVPLGTASPTTQLQLEGVLEKLEELARLCDRGPTAQIAAETVCTLNGACQTMHASLSALGALSGWR
jgi:hypothetical protein